ncbi:MAG: hypothetical protein ACKVX7_01355 [Planctomycetota bacterium]
MLNRERPVDAEAVTDATAAPMVPDASAAPQSPVYARLYEEEQKVDGPSRWSVGAGHRVCHRCQQQLAQRVQFCTVLEPAREVRGRSFDAAEIFERHDYCVSCFPTVTRERIFAHWKSVIPEGSGTARKTVNLASLYATFEQLSERSAATESSVSCRTSTPSLPDDERDRGSDESRADATRDETSFLNSPESVPQDHHLGFLLALFLVRKRQLRWVSIDSNCLTVAAREDDHLYRLPVPPPSFDLTAAEAAFEALFGT